MKKLTNETIDVRLENRNIKRIGDYIDSKTKIEFQCLDKNCLNIWKTTPSIIVKGCGCPKCSDKRLTNKTIDERLIDRGIKRIGNYINARTKIEFQCLENNCLNIWKSKPNNIMNGANCPVCVGKKLTNNIIDDRLKNKDIKRIGEYINNRTKIEFQCLDDNCLNIWRARPDLILDGCGCPKCTVVKRSLTNEIIDKRLIDRNIKRIGKYINNYTKIEFQCLDNNCLNIWNATPNHIINGAGCPNCKNKNEKLIINILKDNNIEFEFQKYFKDFGITINNKYKFDFYIFSLNLIIEYNGRQHYTPTRFGNISYEEAENNLKKQQLRDEYGRQFCKNNNLKLIEIDGREYSGKKLKDYIVYLIENNFYIL